MKGKKAEKLVKEMGAEMVRRWPDFFHMEDGDMEDGAVCDVGDSVVVLRIEGQGVLVESIVGCMYHRYSLYNKKEMEEYLRAWLERAVREYMESCDDAITAIDEALVRDLPEYYKKTPSGIVTLRERPFCATSQIGRLLYVRLPWYDHNKGTGHVLITLRFNPKSTPNITDLVVEALAAGPPEPAPEPIRDVSLVSDVPPSNPPPAYYEKGQIVWDLVVEDMKARNKAGVAKYGTPLQPDNGRNHLQDAYEEALDMAVYLKAEILRRKMTKSG